jgi:hypothetical protein
LRYNLIDWGSSKSDIEAKKLHHEVSQIHAKGTLSERSFQLLTTSIRLAMYDELLAEHELAQELQHFHSRNNAMQSRLQVLANAVNA